MLSIENGFDDHTRNLRLSKVQRPSARVIEKTIHCKEGLSGSRRQREVAA
jgi:hypothetical protein